ncbi:cell wall-binding repeat-containing protein [Corynebacterium glyciniphilum]|uniref:cell wall-binding repeat-containing protein n=1 Tax=Corynebacterium glyciniphilum TaxID=1404244 RepID=UPI0011AB7988|nr:cell wall-binding repeat-containing protein [Corynebacterium glyciniphilum]
MPLSRRTFLLSAGALALAAVPLSACSGDSSSGGSSGSGGGEERARPADGTGVTVIQDDPSGVATSRILFATAEIAVIVAASASDEHLEAGCGLAREHGVPVFADSDSATTDVTGELERLGVSEVVLVGGTDTPSAASASPGTDITVHTTGSDGSDGGDSGTGVAWPDEASGGIRGDDRQRSGVALAVPSSSPTSVATATAAGFTVVPVVAADPRSTDESIEATVDELNGAGNLVALGNGFGSDDDLRRRGELAGAVDGRLPGGGQVMFPGRKIIALYGHANEPLLGVMGEQPPDEAVTRAQQLAEQYGPTSDVPVIPSFEIIVTVAAEDPGPSGNFSNYSDPEEVRPWIEAIVDAGGYAIIDIQPGRETLLQQAQHYADLLKHPSVGLALDPEWRLGPDDQPMVEVGHVDASEINEVAEWLEGLVVSEKLPQKLLMIHQFQLQMIRNREAMVTGTDHVSVAVHCDGHGPQGVKAETWQVVRQGLDPAIALGWKNFIDEDEPMLTPEQTAAVEPTPDIVSYQ